MPFKDLDEPQTKSKTYHGGNVPPVVGFDFYLVAAMLRLCRPWMRG